MVSPSRSDVNTFLIEVSPNRSSIVSDHHHQLYVHFLPILIKGMKSCFPMPLGKQPTFSDTSILGPLVRLALLFLITIRLLIIPGNVGSSFR